MNKHCKKPCYPYFFILQAREIKLCALITRINFIKHIQNPIPINNIRRPVILIFLLQVYQATTICNTSNSGKYLHASFTSEINTKEVHKFGIQNPLQLCYPSNLKLTRTLPNNHEKTSEVLYLCNQIRNKGQMNTMS